MAKAFEARGQSQGPQIRWTGEIIGIIDQHFTATLRHHLGPENNERIINVPLYSIAAEERHRVIGGAIFYIETTLPDSEDNVQTISIEFIDTPPKSTDT